MPYLKSSAHAEGQFNDPSAAKASYLSVVLKSGRRIRDWEEYQLFMTENAQHVVVIAGSETYEEEGDGRRTLEALLTWYAKGVCVVWASVVVLLHLRVCSKTKLRCIFPAPTERASQRANAKYKVEDLEEADALIGKLVGSARAQSEVQ